jgi:hypothetical protein
VIDVGECREEHRIAAGEVGIRAVEQPVGAPAQVGDFRVGQRRPPLERLRPFERRGAVVQPRPLKIGMTAGAGRWNPGAARTRLTRRRGGGCLSENGRSAAFGGNDRCQGGQRRENTTAHLDLRSAADWWRVRPILRPSAVVTGCRFARDHDVDSVVAAAAE